MQPSDGFWEGVGASVGSSYPFCSVNTSGGAESGGAGASYGLAPFGCI